MLRENLNTFIEETIAAQVDVKSARERDRLSALEGLLTQAWRKDIYAKVDEVALPLKKEIATANEELNTLCQELSVAKTYCPDSLLAAQDVLAAHTPAIAAVNPPLAAGAPTTHQQGKVPTTSPVAELPPLNNN